MNAPIDPSRLAPVRDASAWLAAEMADPTRWTVRLPAAALGELVDAARRMPRASLAEISSCEVGRAGLPNAARACDAIESEVMAGRGFVLIQGLDPELDDNTLRACYWIMLKLMGRPVSQNSYGELLCEVMDQGRRIGEARTRGYMTSQDLKFHTDRAAMVTLLCVRQAKSGGRSSICSATSVYNELLAHRPDLVAALFNGLNFMSIEEGGATGATTVRRIPIFDLRDGALSMRYSRNSMTSAILNGVPFTELEKEALEVVDRIANDARFRLDMDFARGDIQAINNFTTLHARTAFEDHPEPHLKRRLTRGWVATRIERPLGSHFADYFGIPVTLERPSA